LALMRTNAGLIPADDETLEEVQKLPMGSVIMGKFSKPRNYQFHRKLFSLLRLAYDHWEPGEINNKYKKPMKSFNRFRKDLIIMAGYYNVVIRLDGSTRIEAQSLSFASMSPEKFEKVYSAIIDKVLSKVMVNMQREDLTDLVEKVIGYA